MGKSFLADIPGNFFAAQLGSNAAIASNGANARLADVGFVAPADLKILSVWRHNLAAAEVTVGTATSSASYRRAMLRNGGSAGTATAILASANNTASQASLGKRSFTVDSTLTVAAGDVLYGDHVTVGAATADGTDMAASLWEIAYQLL
jgi:hypothetical protein